jgi:hypothetical protein
VSAPPAEVRGGDTDADRETFAHRRRARRVGQALVASSTVIGTVVAVWALFFRTPAESRQDPASFEGSVSAPAEQQEFVDFTSAHADKIVRLDVWMDADTWPETTELGGREVGFLMFFFDCPNGVTEPSIEAACTGMQYNIVLDPTGDASFVYSQGSTYLDGYFTVRPEAGMHQGILSTSLIPVRTEDVD